MSPRPGMCDEAPYGQHPALFSLRSIQGQPSETRLSFHCLCDFGRTASEPKGRQISAQPRQLVLDSLVDPLGQGDALEHQIKQVY
jgi:hypothetical protein